MRHHVLSLLMTFAAIGLNVAESSAQPVGTIRWQLQPFCNVLTLNVTAQGSIFALDGYDDQCGAGRRASTVGTAFLNPDGTVGIGLNTVLAPGAAFVHVEARISIASLGGPWRDSAGNGGTFVFTPGGGTGGAARPVPPNGIPPGSINGGQLGPGAVGAAQVDAAQVQRRVIGSCPVGQYLRAIGADGSVTCEPLLLPVSASANVYRAYQTAFTDPIISLSANGSGALVVPFPARLMAYGAAQLAYNAAADTLGMCYISLANGQLVGPAFEQLADNRDTIPLAGTVDVAPGTYDLQIRCSGSVGNGWSNAQLSVIAIPR